MKKIHTLFFLFIFCCSLFLIQTKAKAGAKRIMPTPVAAFYSSDTVFCAEPGMCINFFDISTGNPTSWKWNFPGGIPDTSTQQNPTNICYYFAGTYPVTLIVSNASGSDTLTISPMITAGAPPPPPLIALCGGDTLVCCNDSGLILFNLSYQWYLNGSPIAGATNYFYVATQGGTYAIMITDSNHCSEIGVGNGFVSCPAGFVNVNELTSLADVMIFPNPASQSVTISWPSSIRGNIDITVVNVLGERPSSPLLWRGVRGEAVDVSYLPNGVYFLRIASEEGTVNKKFAVLR